MRTAEEIADWLVDRVEERRPYGGPDMPDYIARTIAELVVSEREHKPGPTVWLVWTSIHRHVLHGVYGTKAAAETKHLAESKRALRIGGDAWIEERELQGGCKKGVSTSDGGDS